MVLKAAYLYMLVFNTVSVYANIENQNSGQPKIIAETDRYIITEVVPPSLALWGGNFSYQVDAQGNVIVPKRAG